MKRRENLAILGQLPLAAGMVLAAEDKPGGTARSGRAGCPTSSAVGQVARGRARVLARSPGGRPDLPRRLRRGGRPRRSTANYNSACGGGIPASYAPQGRHAAARRLPPRPGPRRRVRGHRRAGQPDPRRRDRRRPPRPALARAGGEPRRCRVLIVPSGNPDGRARCPFDSWVGVDLATNERVGMGTKPDGSNYHWPGVKRIHPMRGRGGRHARRLLQRRRRQPDARRVVRPDGGRDAGLPPPRARGGARLRRVPPLAREPPVDRADGLRPPDGEGDIQQIGDRVQRRYAERGPPPPHGGPAPRRTATLPAPLVQPRQRLHHACGGVSFVYECCTATRTAPYPAATHEQILDLQLMFFDELFRYAVEHPIRFLT